MKKIKQRAKIMTLINVNGKNHVIIDTIERNESVKDANFMDTGMALIGILKKGDTLEKFKERWIDAKTRILNMPMKDKETYIEHKARWRAQQ